MHLIPPLPTRWFKQLVFICFNYHSSGIWDRSWCNFELGTIFWINLNSFEVFEFWIKMKVLLLWNGKRERSSSVLNRSILVRVIDDCSIVFDHFCVGPTAFTMQSFSKLPTLVCQLELTPKVWPRKVMLAKWKPTSANTNKRSKRLKTSRCQRKILRFLGRIRFSWAN